MGSIGAKSKFRQLSIVVVDRVDEEDNPFIDMVELVLCMVSMVRLLIVRYRQYLSSDSLRFN